MNPIQTKSFAFSVEIVKTYKYLTKNHREYSLFRQLLNSGTSIAANVEEGLGGQSKRDFIAKLSISYKESRETDFWLRLLRETGYLNTVRANELIQMNQEISKILFSIIRSTRANL